jgi:hemoglobin-like flavoprotein
VSGPRVTDRQKALIRESFERIRKRRQEAGERFYERLFELDPASRGLFRTGIGEQSKKLMHTLAIIVAALDRFERIEPAMEDLGARHAHYGVLGNHYETVEDALVWALEQTLGAALTPDAGQAWRLLYREVAGVMRRGPQR